MEFVWFILVGLVAGWCRSACEGRWLRRNWRHHCWSIGGAAWRICFSFSGISAGGGLIGSIVVATAGVFVLSSFSG